MLLPTLGIFGAAMFAYYLARSLRMQRIGPDQQVSRHFAVKDFLQSASVPALRHYHLTPYEHDNLRRLTAALDVLVDRFGKPRITSGGRPQSLADFVSILRAKGYKAVKHSQHNEFAAVDLTFGSAAKDTIVYEWAKSHRMFHQLLLYLRRDGDRVKSHIHLSVADDKRPEVKRAVKIVADDPSTIAQVKATL